MNTLKKIKKVNFVNATPKQNDQNKTTKTKRPRQNKQDKINDQGSFGFGIVCLAFILGIVVIGGGESGAFVFIVLFYLGMFKLMGIFPKFFQ
ncbi:MAG: hypothetical protein NTZ13_04920 [Candidatus Parcubacteria bacterium]|nr:hypothetical protein [Candidatus Parcubacteria bacterium]